MRRDLVTAMRDAGVDTLQTHEVEITDPTTGDVNHDYWAVNLIGLVAAANMEQSEYSDPSGHGLVDVDFDSLVISPAAARGLPIFRLAQCVTGVVIAESLRIALEGRGGFDLDFIEPESWVG